jgi:hypothetical protein
VATVFTDRIELTLKELEIANEGERLWQVGNNRPHETVSIADDIKEKGFVTVGTAVLHTEDGNRTITQATGHFEREDAENANP